jgi:hypothetical protein
MTSNFELLFALYSAADLENLVRDHNHAKDKDDPVVSVHCFLSQILRDMFFACSYIDFGYEISRSRDVHLEQQSARLYVLIESMLTSLWKRAGMPYVGVAHGSDTNYIFIRVFPKGQVSESDQVCRRRSRWRSSVLLQLVDPIGPLTEGEKYWPKSFQRTARHAEEPQPRSGL